MNDVIVSIRDVSKQFGAVKALHNISLEIKSGEIFALLGPSGCGKSTLLRVISGFESPSSGQLLLDGKDMLRTPPNKRPINMVFQSYAVFPHMSVADNVAYGLKMERVAAAEIKQRVSDALEQVHLADFAKRMPDQLSGGQRQRVALARALVKRPRVLLLDEPLSALDAKLRDAMRLELVKLQETVGITFIIVTHDQSEAMAMADRIAVLESGRLRQVASPTELYQQPADAFVADFIGKIHTFDVTEFNQTSNELIVETLNPIIYRGPLPESAKPIAGNYVVGIRPEHIHISTQQPDNNVISIQGHCGDIAFQGQHSITEVVINQDLSLTSITSDSVVSSLQSLPASAPIWAYWHSEDMLLLAKAANP